MYEIASSRQPAVTNYQPLLGVRPCFVAAVHAAGAQRGAVAGAVGGGVVRPVALNLPVGSVDEGHVLSAEGPGALIAVLVAIRSVPGIAIGVGAGFAQL